MTLHCTAGFHLKQTQATSAVLFGYILLDALNALYSLMKKN